MAAMSVVNQSNWCLAIGEGPYMVLVSIVVLSLNCIIIFNFEVLFRAVIGLLTHFMLPLMGLCYFIVIGWFRDWPQATAPSVLANILKWHIRITCPLLMLMVFYNVI